MVTVASKLVHDWLWTSKISHPSILFCDQLSFRTQYMKNRGIVNKRHRMDSGTMRQQRSYSRKSPRGAGSLTYWDQSG